MAGDYDMGQGYALFMIAGSVTVAMLLYFVIICFKSNFQWLSANLGMRILLLTTFFITLLLTLFFSYYFAIEWHGDKLFYF